MVKAQKYLPLLALERVSSLVTAQVVLSQQDRVFSLLIGIPLFVLSLRCVLLSQFSEISVGIALHCDQCGKLIKNNSVSKIICLVVIVFGG